MEQGCAEPSWCGSPSVKSFRYLLAFKGSLIEMEVISISMSACMPGHSGKRTQNGSPAAAYLCVHQVLKSRCDLNSHSVTSEALSP